MEYRVKTYFNCNFEIKSITLNYLPDILSHNKDTMILYDVNSEAHLLRQIRILIFLNYSNFIIYTNTDENILGWRYALNQIFSGQYALQFSGKNIIYPEKYY